MKKVISWVKSIRPVKIVTALMAVFILFFTQACGGGDSATATAPKSTSGLEPAPQTVGPQKARPNAEVYAPKGEGVVSPNEGGMNNFSDVDPRTVGVDVKSKAEALRENAERNVIDETANIGETTRRILDKKGENVEDLGKNLQRSAEFTKDRAQDTVEDLTQGTKKGVQNIKENTKDAAKDTTSNVHGAAADTVKQAGANLKYSAKETSEDLKQQGKNVIEQGGDYLQGKVDEVTGSAKRNLDKAGDAVKDAVH
jgi:ElaB/YqjD/DUF883 family membrane-anchored ribosome-binding protein